MQTTVGKFLKYYSSVETRPVFESVDEMLKWAGLYNLTTRTLQDELLDAKLSPSLVQELVTVRFWICSFQILYILLHFVFDFVKQLILICFLYYGLAIVEVCFFK